VIRVEEARARIGGSEVLRGVSLSVSPGELVAVIGANGAGKTSLLRAISGLLPLESGRIAFDGSDVAGRAPHLLSRAGLIHVPQGRRIVPGLTVRENLLLGAEHAGVPAPELERRMAAEFDRFPVLRERQGVDGASLSGGEQQMLAVSRGLMMGPKVLLLDEPSLGLAPQVVQAILRTLRILADAGLAVLLVEQAALLALDFADRAIVMRNGECVLQDRADALRGRRELVDGYLS
jgi:branched-chain amino acid transport system ATP-binding protein